MGNLQLSARQIQMMCQQLKVAMAQNDVVMENKVMEQLKTIADDVVANENSWRRLIPYVIAIKAIYDVYEKRADYFSRCELAIESLVEMSSLEEYINQEEYASMVTLHLDMALYPMYQMHMNLVRQNIEHDTKALTLLADLLNQHMHNLIQINPSNDLISGLFTHVKELDELGLIDANWDMSIDDLYPYIILLRDYWDESKSIYLSSGNNCQSLFNERSDEDSVLMPIMFPLRFGIPNDIALNESIDDMILSPLYEGLNEIIDYDKIISDLDPQESICNGFSFARAFLNFSYYYEQYCNNNHITPSILSTLYIDEAIPYCQSTRATQLLEEAKQCFFSLANTIGIELDELTEMINNDDMMLDMAESSDEHLQPLIISLVEMNIETEGILIFNRNLTLKALAFEDEAIAVGINQFVERLQQYNLLTEEPPHYSEHDIKCIFNNIQYIE